MQPIHLFACNVESFFVTNPPPGIWIREFLKISLADILAFIIQ